MPSINIKNDTLTADILTSEAGPGSGIGTSSICNTSGPPYWWNRNAFI